MKLALRKKKKQDAESTDAAAPEADAPATDGDDQNLSKKELKQRAKEEAAAKKAAAKEVKQAEKEAKARDKQKIPAGGGAKGFLVHHVEKLVLVVVFGLCGYLIYSAFGRQMPGIDRSPDDLATIVEDISKKMAESSPVVDPVEDYSSAASRGTKRIQAKGLTWDRPFNEEIAPPLVKRDRPAVYAVKGLIARGGVGLFFTKRKEKPLPWARPRGAGGGMGGERKPLPKEFSLGGTPLPKPTRGNVAGRPGRPAQKPAVPHVSGRAWVSVMGKVPFAQQEAEFHQKFLHAFNHKPPIDRPIYGAVQIERAEIIEGTDVTQINWNAKDDPMIYRWQEISLRRDGKLRVESDQYKAQAASWFMRASEVADPRLVVSSLLTQPLGPLAYGTWDRWATHPDLVIEDVFEEIIEEIEIKPEIGADGKRVKPGPIDWLDDEEDPVVETGDDEMAEEAEPVTKKVIRRRVKKAGKVDHKLVRIFDFSVLPGKQYVYRIRLHLMNPNHREFQHPRDLVSPGVGKGRTLRTEWSEPSNVAVIPSPDLGRASALAFGKTDHDTRASFVVRGPELTQGVLELAELKGRQRGQIASGNSTRYSINLIQKMVSQGKDREFTSGLVLLDFRSGRSMPQVEDETREEQPNYAAPAEMLFVDGQGNLTISDATGGGGELAILEEAFAPVAAEPDIGIGGDRKDEDEEALRGG